MEEKIRTKLEELRGFLQADGGDLEIVSIEPLIEKLVQLLAGRHGLRFINALNSIYNPFQQGFRFSLVVINLRWILHSRN